MPDFQDLVNRYVKEAFSFFPVHATDLGVHDYDDKLESFSKESCQDLLKFVKRYSGEREKFDPNKLSPSDQCDHALMGIELAAYELDFLTLKKWQKDPALYVETILEGVYYLIIRNTSQVEYRAHSLLLRMKKFPELLSEAKRNLKNPPKTITEAGIERTIGTIEFLKKECDSKKITGSLKLQRELEKEMGKTLEALESYGEWLKSKLLPSSRGNYAIGKSLFDHILKKIHLLPYSTDDLLAIGEEHLRTTLEEMKKLAKSINPNKSWKELLTDSGLEYPAAEQLVPEYRRMTEKARAFVKEMHLAPLPAHDEIVVMETPPFARGFRPYASYTTPPFFGETTRGEFWVTPPDRVLPENETQRPIQSHAYSHAIPLFVAHETYPGHHLQFSFMRELSSPMVKRAASPATFEGWGLYCEEIMKDQGFYENPLTHLEQLKAQLWRVIRVILDVGLHTGQVPPKKAINLLRSKVGLTELAALNEVKRYLRVPTQPMSYFIGKLEILKLRNAYNKKKGNKFSLFDFHREFLHCGPIPIKLAEVKVLSGD